MLGGEEEGAARGRGPVEIGCCGWRQVRLERGEGAGGGGLRGGEAGEAGGRGLDAGETERDGAGAGGDAAAGCGAGVVGR